MSVSDKEETIKNGDYEENVTNLSNSSSDKTDNDSFYQELKSKFCNIFTDSDQVYMDYVNGSIKSNPPIIKLKMFTSNNRKRHHYSNSSSSTTSSNVQDSYRNNDKRYSDQYYRQNKRPNYHNRSYNNNNGNNYNNYHDRDQNNHNKRSYDDKSN